MVGDIAVVGFVVGMALTLLGALRRTPAQTLLGAAIACYALTLEKYGGLVSSAGRLPITTEDRERGTEFAIVAGAILSALVLAIVHAERTGAQSWADARFRRQLGWIGVAAVASVIGVWIALRVGGPFEASTDFLNEFGDRPAVVVYQLIFMAWVGGPEALLGWLTRRYLTGPGRWVLAIGCSLGLAWSIWKLLGVAVRFSTGHRIELESPVSVVLGASSMGIVLVGLLVLACCRMHQVLSTRRWTRTQHRETRQSRDAAHYGR